MTVEIKLVFQTYAEAAAFLNRGNGKPSASASAETAVAPEGEPVRRGPGRPKKVEVPVEPDTSQQELELSPMDDEPVAETPAELPKPVAPLTYEKTGIAEKIAGYLGSKEDGKYIDRRAKMVALLSEFSVKSGKELKADQFAPFEARLNSVIGPAAAMA